MRLVRPTWFTAVSATALIAFVLTCSPPPTHAQGVPGFDKNKCLAGKTKCVNEKVKGLLKCRERCQKNPKNCGRVQMECDTKVRDKFDGGATPAKGCFAKREAKEKRSKPASSRKLSRRAAIGSLTPRCRRRFSMSYQRHAAFGCMAKLPKH